MLKLNRSSLLLAVLVLAGLVAGSIAFKIHAIHHLPFYNPQDGEGFFWTETAFHYRYAALVSRGQPIPPLDKEIQYPEGLDTRRFITPVMEEVAGRLHRWFFSAMPLHVFLTWFSAVFSSFSVLAVFLAARFLWNHNWAGLLAAAFYVLAPAGFTRTAGGGFIREDFALPWIFFSFAFFLACLRRDRLLFAFISGGALVVALASWHVTPFYVFIFAAGFALLLLLFRPCDLPRKSFTILTAMLALAAVFLPVLRDKWFIVSPALMICYAVVLCLWLLPRWRWDFGARKIIAAGFAIFAFLAVGLWLQHSTGGYSHVYQLLLAKLRFMGTLPADPAKLSFESRVMWSSSFVSPQAMEVISLLSVTIIPAVISLAIIIFRLVRRRAASAEIITLFFALVTFILFLLIYRMDVFAVFFFAVAAGILVLAHIRVTRILSAVLVIASLCVGLYLIFLVHSISLRPPPRQVNEVIDFLKDNSAPGDAVLTSFELGPSIAAYADRPVILHSKFESKRLRDKVCEVYTALYGSEDDLYNLCRKYQARCLVYQYNMALGVGRGSFRYMAGQPVLKAASAVALLHFAPDKLRHFQLVYQNRRYRVYRIADHFATPPPKLPYEPLYDLMVYREPDNHDSVISDKDLYAGQNHLIDPQTHLRLADRFFARGEYDTALREYQQALALNAKFAPAYEGLAQVFAARGDYTQAVKMIQIAIQLAPHQPHLAELLNKFRQQELFWGSRKEKKP